MLCCIILLLTKGTTPFLEQAELLEPKDGEDGEEEGEEGEEEVEQAAVHVGGDKDIK